MLIPRPAQAWIFSEHRDLTAAGLARLEPADAAALEALWAEARRGYDGHPCEAISAGDLGTEPACLDFAAWPAAAADHSCSARSFGPGGAAVASFDACRTAVQPRADRLDPFPPSLAAILQATPVPGRPAGEVHVPRLREELGPFVGPSASWPPGW